MRAQTLAAALVAAAFPTIAAGCAPPPLPDPAVLARAWARHLDPVHGVSVRRPAYWALQDAERRRYGAQDGQMRLFDDESPVADAEAAARALAAKIGFPGADVEAATVDGQAVRLVTPRWPGTDRAWTVMAYPAPIKRTFGDRTAGCVVLETNRIYHRPLTASLRTERAPADYMEGGLAFMARYSFKRDVVDWAAVRQAALKAAGPLASLKDAHKGLDAALGVIADRHSFLLAPRDTEQFFSPGATGFGFNAEDWDGKRTVTRIYAGSPAAAQDLRMGDVVAAAERLGGGTERFTIERPGAAAPHVVTITPGNYATTLLPTYTAIAPGVAYVELPDTVATANYDPYRRKLAEVVAQGDADGARAWIVDVRRNSGGSHWAMMAPLASLIGEGVCGGTENADGTREGYRVLGNRIYEGESPIDADLVPPTLARQAPPVAVLHDRLSASAAEAVVLAFLGRPAARTFGGPTLGVPTSNTAFELWDGAFLNLATYRGLDRLGRAWDAPIPPDQPAATRWSAFGTPEDPCVAAALAWLAGQ